METALWNNFKEFAHYYHFLQLLVKNHDDVRSLEPKFHKWLLLSFLPKKPWRSSMMICTKVWAKPDITNSLVWLNHLSSIFSFITLMKWKWLDKTVNSMNLPPACTGYVSSRWWIYGTESVKTQQQVLKIISQQEVIKTWKEFSRLP